MGIEMELGEVVLSLASLPDHTYIYVREDVVDVSATTTAMLLDYEDPKPAGWRYFLETPTVREVLYVWSSWRDNRTPSLEEACAAVIYYAENDAYIIDDLE